ncbi:MAG: citrate lyase acyl carrier protein [Spirochaetes bacterium]|nr:citrate lyase acyl carrier protein [Spirochaetota bacterium]
MTIVNEASAGTAESGDARVTVRPNAGGGIALELRGPSVARYGDEIRAVALSTLEALGVADAAVTVDEKGALDATIRARLAAAAGRAAGAGDMPWEAMS